jgi:SpoIID/LytB domain protein
VLSTAQIESALNADPQMTIGKLRELRVSATDASGRARTVQVEGDLDTVAAQRQEDGSKTVNSAGRAAADAGGPPLPGSAPAQLLPPTLQPQPVSRMLDGYAFRRAIGTRRLKSTRFTIERIDESHYRFTGSGYGHGVGLCQIGARGMASAPYRRSFRQILAHYYRGITIAPFHPAGQPP